jgi:hypothetical protein
MSTFGVNLAESAIQTNRAKNGFNLGEDDDIRLVKKCIEVRRFLASREQLC